MNFSVFVTRILPTVLIILDVLTALVYSMWEPDVSVMWRKVVYWIAAAILTAVVTF